VSSILVVDDDPVTRRLIRGLLEAAGFEVTETPDAPAALAAYFGAAAQHRPAAPAPRLGLVRAWTALGDRERVRGELEVLRRLQPDLATLVEAQGGLS